MHEQLLFARKKGAPSGDTRLLMHFDGNWRDECGATVTANADFNTTTKRFGSASASFPGNRQVTVSANGDRYANGITEATLEAWMYKTDNPSWSFGIGQGYDSSSGRGWCFSPADGGDMLNVWKNPNGSSGIGVLVPVGGIPNGVWVHVAMTWKNNIATGFVAGKKQLSVAMPYWIFDPLQNLEIGYIPYARSYTFPGLMDELRFSASCLYDGDFVPPTAPFTI